MAKKDSAVATQQEGGALAFPSERPSYIPDSKRGSENVTMDDRIMPRLDIIQSLSPQKKSSKDCYIEGAEDGDLFNTVSSEIYGDSVMFVPVYMQTRWLVWKDRDFGGGLRGIGNTLAEGEAIIAKCDPAERHLLEATETKEHFGFLLFQDGSTEDICVSMAKSKLKPSRTLNTLIEMRGGDRFSSVYRLSSCDDQNSANQDYKNFRVDPMGWTPEPLFKKAEALYEVIAAGKKGVNYSEPEEGGAPASERDDEM